MNPLIDHLDIWTSAWEKKASGGRGSNGKLNPYGIQKLRELILELAVRGRLVPQDPNDEPASVLLEKIAKEKARLMKEGKIKKQKKMSEITEQEMPFNLPSGWEWVRLGNLLLRISNGYSGKQNKNGHGHPISRIETISNSIIDMEKVGYSTEIPRDKLGYYRLHCGDILLSHINSDYHVGKTAIVPEGITLYHGVNLLLLRTSSHVLPRYIDLSINSLRLSGYFLKIAQHAIGQASINQSKVVAICLGVPPLAEQHRIVAKVDELMALCDRLEQEQTDSREAHQTLVETLLRTLVQAPDAEAAQQAWQRIAQHFDLLFTTEAAIDQLKQTILQLAVMGKLVPQNPNDEPASVLLEKIAEEKARLTNAKEIRKTKRPATYDEEPQDFLPPNWAWTILYELGEIGPRNGLDDNLETAFVPMALIPDGYGKKARFETRLWKEIKTGFTHFRDGDVVLAKITPCFQNGKSAVMSGLPNGYGAGTTELHVFRPIEGTIVPEYVLLFLKSPGFLLEGIPRMTGTAGQKRITRDYFAGKPFPLPPLAEQHRIVAKVDELMALCDALKARIQESETTQRRLADAVVHQAVGQ